MATKQEIEMAIERFKIDPKNTSDHDKELVKRAAEQQGKTGNDAKEALGQKRTGLFG